MTEQLDTNADASADAQTTMQSEETTDATVTLADRIEQAFTDVLPALIAQLYQQYEGEIAPLQAKQAGLEEEYDALEQAAQKLQAILPAQERLAQAEADRLMVSGQLQEAKAKIAEMEQAQHAPAAMHEQQREISARIHEIDAEKKAIAKRVFEEWYGQLQPVVRASEHGLLITLLGGLEESFYQFQASTGTGTSDNRQRPLLNQGHFSSLTADGRSAEWAAGHHWYA